MRLDLPLKVILHNVFKVFMKGLELDFMPANKRSKISLLCFETHFLPFSLGGSYGYKRLKKLYDR
jgi:hypothetical protein